MLIWICALHCEAKPVIDFFRLKKSHDDRAFDLYRGDDMVCVISGIGKIASAAATAWTAAMFAREPASAWINLGVAGAAQHEIGKLFLLDKIIDDDSGQSWYPVPVTASTLPGSTCLTLNRPGENYREDMLFDMEASGFMQTALRFSSAELIQVLKVVSDNRLEQTGRDRQRISELIAADIDTIAVQANALIDLRHEVAALEPSQESWQHLLGMAHFTQTQKSRLRVLWRYLWNRDVDSDALLAQLTTNKSAESIILALERLSHRDSEGL
jgi:nucleoside phosphorylase